MPRPRPQPRKKLLATAFHEAGHAVMAYLVRRRIKRVSIEPDEKEGSLGHVENWRLRIRPDIRSNPYTNERLDDAVKISLAGGIAEAIYTGRKNHVGATGDYRNASDYAMHRCGSAEQAVAYLRWQSVCARQIMENPRYWKGVKVLAEALMKQPTIPGAEATKIIEQAIYPGLPAVTFGKVG